MIVQCNMLAGRTAANASCESQVKNMRSNTYISDSEPELTTKGNAIPNSSRRDPGG